MNCKNCKQNPCSLAGKDHEMSFECKRFVGRSNADRLRSMSDEDLAAMKIICRVTAENLDECEKWRFPDGSPDCYSCALDWLKQEATDDYYIKDSLRAEMERE